MTDDKLKVACREFIEWCDKSFKQTVWSDYESGEQNGILSARKYFTMLLEKHGALLHSCDHQYVAAVSINNEPWAETHKPWKCAKCGMSIECDHNWYFTRGNKESGIK